MPTDKTGEFGNVFEPLLKKKLERAGYFYVFEDNDRLFDDEHDEDSENEDSWDNRA